MNIKDSDWFERRKAAERTEAARLLVGLFLLLVLLVALASSVAAVLS
jgi:hypothetical protein